MYVQILLPLKLRWIPTYISDMPLLRGEAVKVLFSGRRYTGIVWNENAEAPSGVSRLLKVLGRDEAVPPLSGNEMSLWTFVANYYLCTLGEVFSMALPGMRLRSEQNASAAIERLQRQLSGIDRQLSGRHCGRVRLRLEAKRAEVLAKIGEISPTTNLSIQDGESIGSPNEITATSNTSANPPKPQLLVCAGADRLTFYIDAIRAELQNGRQTLLLTPEVAFCNRLESALKEEFGAKLAIVHSGKTPTSRQRTAMRLRNGQSLVVLGTRSSVFLPFYRLGLVIIDDEQDPFYKQSEPAPRYNGRDCAIFLAGLHSAAVMLGTACPSLETLLNLHSGKYLPIDPTRQDNTTECTREDSLPADTNPPSGSDLAEMPSDGLTVIDIAAERRKNGMKGPLSRKLIAAVLAARGPVLLIRGWEKQEELSEYIDDNLPDSAVTVCTLAELKHNGFGSVSMIAVLQADALLSKDDFRSDERALQLTAMLMEFAPRVLIQTEVPQRFASSPDALLSERRQFGFPPYTRIVDIRRYGSGEIVNRLFLKRDSSLAARKADIFATLPDDCYADVDPQ